VLGPVVVSAVFAWNLGWSRRLAELAIRHQFEVRAEHIAGVENVRADRLSRQLQQARSLNLRLKPRTFRSLVGGGAYAPSVDCCCDVLGLNAQAGCDTFFSPDNSVLGQAAQLAGKVLWAFPPKTLVGEVLSEIEAAHRLDRSTRATVVVPHWPERPWFRQFVRGSGRGSELFRVLSVLGKGRSHYLWPWGAEADPADYDLLVLRLN
jgi:hypothetical protein